MKEIKEDGYAPMLPRRPINSPLERETGKLRAFWLEQYYTIKVVFECPWELLGGEIQLQVLQVKEKENFSQLIWQVSSQTQV